MNWPPCSARRSITLASSRELVSSRQRNEDSIGTPQRKPSGNTSEKPVRNLVAALVTRRHLILSHGSALALIHLGVLFFGGDDVVLAPWGICSEHGPMVPVCL